MSCSVPPDLEQEMSPHTELSRCPSTRHWDDGTVENDIAQEPKNVVQWRVLGGKQAMFSLRLNCLACKGTSWEARKGLFQPEDRIKKRSKKRGRPPSAPHIVRRHTIGVRVNEGEFVQLKERAQRMGLSPAQWLRTAALDRKIPKPPAPAINRALYAELARLSVNLNQLSRAVNAGQLTGNFIPIDEPRTLSLLCALHKVIHEVQVHSLGLSNSPNHRSTP